MNGLSLVTLGKISCCECKYYTILPIELDLEPVENYTIELQSCPEEFNLEIVDTELNLNITMDEVNLENNDQDINLDC